MSMWLLEWWGELLKWVLSLVSGVCLPQPSKSERALCSAGWVARDYVRGVCVVSGVAPPPDPIFLFVGVNHSLLIPSEDAQPCILVYGILSLWMVSLLPVLETSVRARKPVELEGAMREWGQSYHRLSWAISSRRWIAQPQRVLWKSVTCVYARVLPTAPVLANYIPKRVSLQTPLLSHYFSLPSLRL